MPPSVYFSCLLFNEDPRQTSLIRVDGLNSPVIELKNAIFEDKRHTRFRFLESCHLQLYLWEGYQKPSEESDLADKEMDDLEELSKYFPTKPPRGVPHIVVKFPLPLLCLLYGYPQVEPFHIEANYLVATTTSIRHQIKEEMKHTLEGYDAAQLELWKVSIPLDSNLNDIHKNFEFKEGRVFYELSSTFAEPPKRGHIHLIVRVPDSQHNTNASFRTDPISQYMKIISERFKDMRLDEEPSSMATMDDYKKFQGNKMPIIDGCYDADNPRNVIGPPIALYHPVFAQFKDDINNENLSIPNEFLRQTVQFMHTLSGLYEDEDEREEALEETLEPVFKQLFGESRDYCRPDATPDCDILVNRKLVQPRITTTTAAVMIRENRTGLGESGDASVQVCFSMMKFWLNDKAQLFRRNCCCPTLLIATSGPWLVIIGGIAVDYFIFQRLTDTIWLGRDSGLNERHVRRIARILFSLKRGIDTLRKYYETVPIGTGSVIFAPSIKEFIGEDNQRKGFEYITKLQPKNSACVTFLAQTIDIPLKKIVVKFVDRYGEEAHRELEKENMAPKLYACHDLSALGDLSYAGLKIVVMEYLEGAAASEVFYRQPLPLRIVSGIKTALDVLHKGDFVFGDLRRSNIRIVRDKDQELVKLIDFDWAGKHDRDCYPLNISTEIKWPQGVRGLARMMKEHDIEMLEMITT